LPGEGGFRSAGCGGCAGCGAALCLDGGEGVWYYGGMLDFAGLQNAVKAKLEEDRQIYVIEATGANLKEAVTEAANTLSVSVGNIEYEVLAETSSFLGLGRDFCRIRAFETKESKRRREESLLQKSMADGDDAVDIEFGGDRDGEVFVQRRPGGVFIKVSPAAGKGKRASAEAAFLELKKKRIANYDKKVVEDLVREAGGEYRRVANYPHNEVNDTTVEVEVSGDGMNAYITVHPPGFGGADLTYEIYCEYLQNHNVVFGVNDLFLSNFADNPIYHQKVCAATGKKAEDGIDAHLEYYFDVSGNKVRIKEQADGKVDFKELNIIQNVLKGEQLAKKIQAVQGTDGTTVTGQSIPAKEGKDITVALGENVSFARDGETIIADIDGQVVLVNNKISVEEVYIVPGSVNLETGNIVFLGNIVITGDVEEGFSVKASGNIEVHGSIDRATVSAEGDVVAFKGIKGRADSSVRAGGAVWTKFVENANITAGGSIVVTDGIVNSTLLSSKEIICIGKRAGIVGGKCRAGESILAQTIGSKVGNTETICEVGFDPLTVEKIEEVKAEKKAKEGEVDNINENIRLLRSINDQRGGLPPDKLAYYKELNEKKKVLLSDIEDVKKRLAGLEATLETIKSSGKISAVDGFYSGVVINIFTKSLTLHNDYKSTTFFMENDIIRKALYDGDKNKEKDKAKQPEKYKG